MPNQSPLRQERTETQQLRIELITSLTTLGELFEETTRKDDEIIDECLDNLLDVLIHALPEDRDAYRDGSNLSYEIYGYNSALSEVKHLLLEAKGTK